MGRILMVELDGRVYRCPFCRTQLALIEDLISKSFHCRHGKAYLFNHGTNISVGDEEERVLFSGMHTVADIFCCCCGQNVGWKYVVAQEKIQKYKEGKFVLERGRIADGTDLEFYVDTRPSGSGNVRCFDVDQLINYFDVEFMFLGFIWWIIIIDYI
ncbi:protein yippee-like At5g53940 isoform X1 [Musa acuminata AAA Group]|uniref:protein yippee-like At5g53940 isoform X1 n=1 Tax=Musa acuminata AAA Group TaxID=214697 RepID=UPI0031E06D4D